LKELSQEIFGDFDILKGLKSTFNPILFKKM